MKNSEEIKKLEEKILTRDMPEDENNFFNIHLRKIFKEKGYKKQFQNEPNYYHYLLWLNKIIGIELTLLYQYNKENHVE